VEEEYGGKPEGFVDRDKERDGDEEDYALHQKAAEPRRLHELIGNFVDDGGDKCEISPAEVGEQHSCGEEDKRGGHP